MAAITTSAQLREFTLRILTENRPFPHILNEVCTVAGIQCIVLDEDARLQAHSQKLFHSSPIWTGILGEGGIPYRYFFEYPKLLEELWQLTKTCRLVHSSMGADMGLCVCFAPMLLNKSLAGYVIACADTAFDRQLLEDTAMLLGRVYLHKFGMSERTSDQVDGLFVTAITWELLASDTESISELMLSERIAPLLKMPRIPLLRPPFQIAALRSLGNLKRKSLIQLGRQLRSKVPNLFLLDADRRLLVLFVNMRNERKDVDDILVSFSSDNNLLCGLSLPFESLTERRFHKMQALDALRLGSQQASGERVFTAQSLYPEILFKAVVDKFGAHTLWRMDLQVLAKHDYQYGTAYLETLKQFLCSGGSHTKAANSLFVDRSTLNYRLTKIRSMMDCDLDDPDVALQLLVAINIYNMALRIEA